MNKKKYEKPLTLDMNLDEALQRFSQTNPKEITSNASKINTLAQKQASKEITSQGELFQIEVERDIGGIGMGVLSDGTPYLNQRGLATLCGVQNAHIGTISAHWNEEPSKPRIAAIKEVLEKAEAEIIPQAGG